MLDASFTWNLALGSVTLLILVLLLRRSGDSPLSPAWSSRGARLDSGRGFALTCAALCGIYLVIQLAYAIRMPLADDEFAGIKAVYRTLHILPYRDFNPYKTVLGYYIQALPLRLTDGLWQGIVAVRCWMAILNASVLLLAALWLARHFRGRAVVLGLALLIVMSTFVERSFVLRVDMMASLWGLVALLLLLERRPAWAGLAAGLGFLTSQKALYFLVAGGAALAGWWLFGDRRRDAFARAAAFSLTALAIIVAYFAFWSWIGSFEKAVLRVFEVSTDIGLSDRPHICPRQFWHQTVLRNPLFYSAGLFALGLLGREALRRRGEREVKLALFSVTMVALSLWHKQPCPYFFVILIPTLFVLQVWLFDHAFSYGQRLQPATVRAVAALYLAIGLLMPLSRVPIALARDNAFQRQTLELAAALVGPEETYMASFPLLYDRYQAIPEVRWLDDMRRFEIRRMDQEEVAAMLTKLDQTPLKLLVMNYRMKNIRPIFNRYFAANYAHFWGNIHLYAPRLDAQATELALKFTALYEVKSERSEDSEEDRGELLIDGRAVVEGERLRLTRGAHDIQALGTWRLALVPEGLDAALLDPQFEAERAFFGPSFHY